MCGPGRCSIVCGLLLLLTVGAGTTPCTRQEIERCLEPLEGYEYRMDNAIVPTMDEDTLREHCQRYDLFEDCMQDVKPNCGLVDRRIFEGIEDSYQFMCYDGFEEYKEHRECFKNKGLHREGDSCNETFTERLANLSPTYSRSYRSDRICQYVNQYLDCVDNVVESFCGSDAAEWQRTLDIKSLQPLLDEIDCSLSTSVKSHRVLIIVGVVIGVAALIIIISVALVCRKRQVSQRPPPVPSVAPSQPSGAPPPYSVPTLPLGYIPGAQAPTTPPEAGHVYDKVEPPPYEPTATDTTPAYPPQSLQDPPPTGATGAVPYFGANPTVGSAPVQFEETIDEKSGPLP